MSLVRQRGIRREAGTRQTHVETARVTALLLADQFAIHCFNSKALRRIL